MDGAIGNPQICSHNYNAFENNINIQFFFLNITTKLQYDTLNTLLSNKLTQREFIKNKDNIVTFTLQQNKNYTNTVKIYERKLTQLKEEISTSVTIDRVAILTRHLHQLLR